MYVNLYSNITMRSKYVVHTSRIEHVGYAVGNS